MNGNTGDTAQGIVTDMIAAVHDYDNSGQIQVTLKGYSYNFYVLWHSKDQFKTFLDLIVKAIWANPAQVKIRWKITNSLHEIVEFDILSVV
jgi:hypothetical protein